MLGTLGVLVLLVSLALVLNNKFNFYSPMKVKGGRRGIPFITMVIGIALMFSNQLFFIADAGTTYTMQPKFKLFSKSAQYTIAGRSGFQGRWFAKVTPVDVELTIKTLTPKQYQQYKKGDRQESEETYVLPANPVSFNDKIAVWLGTTTIIDCQPDSDGFTNVVIKGKSESNIVYQRIVPLINEVQGNLVKLFGTEDYIEGAKVIASQMFYDQLQNGKYKVVEDPEYEGETSSVLDSVLTTTSSRKMVNRYILDRYPKGTKDSSGVDIGGEIIRTSLGLGAFGFSVRTGQIESEEYHPDFEKQLDDIRKIQASSQKLKQDTEKQIRQQEYEEAKAEADRIREEGEQKVLQAKKVIAAQTKAEEAEFYLDEQTKLLAGEKKATEIAAEKAEQIRKLRNSGGIDPKEELQMRLDNDVRIAQAVYGPEGLVLPTTYINSGDKPNGGDDLLSKLIAADIVKSKGN